MEQGQLIECEQQTLLPEHSYPELSRLFVTGTAAGLALTAVVIHILGLLRGNWWQLGTILFYLMIFFLFLFRHESLDSLRSVNHWFFALGGTWLPFGLIPSQAPPSPLLWLSLPLQFAGMTLSILALAALGKSFGVIAARRMIKQHGPYAVVRHPLYLGEMLWFFSVVLQNLSASNLAIFAAQVGCQIRRLLDEESLLSKDASYMQYTKSVRYRLVPGLF